MWNSEDGRCLFNFQVLKREHNAVRYEIGLFDVSHMGEIEVTGKDASQFVQYLLSNDTDNLTTSKHYILLYVMKKAVLLMI